MTDFQPTVEMNGPNASSGKNHLGTVRIELADRRVHVLFYDDGRLRLRVNEMPMNIYECYLRGGQNDFTIVGLRPE